MNLQLGQLVFKCHKAVLSSISPTVKAVVADNQEGDGMVNSSSFGMCSENSQSFYNVFELVYLGREVIFDRKVYIIGFLRLLF